MRGSRVLLPIVLLLLVTSCSNDKSWPPPDRYGSTSTPIFHPTADSVRQTLQEDQFEKLNAILKEHDYRASFVTTVLLRDKAELLSLERWPFMLIFTLHPTSGMMAGLPEKNVTLRFIWDRPEQEWTLLTYDGFLSLDSGQGSRVVGSPRLEVAIQDAFETKDLTVYQPFPDVGSVPLREDSLTRVELAKALAPYDSAIRSIADQHDLQESGEPLFYSLTVPAMDSLDYELGIREGILGLNFSRDTDHNEESETFPLRFVRPGHDARWHLLRGSVRPPVPDTSSDEASQSDFEREVAEALDEIRALFDSTITAEQWWQRRKKLRRTAASDRNVSNVP